MLFESSIQKNQFQQSVVVATAVLAVMHLAGLAGLMWTVTQPYFLKLVPLHLLCTMLLVLWFHTSPSRSFLYFVGCAFLSGFLIEVVGVHTGVVFGSYTYGATLGWQLAEVPLIIGCNWLTLLYCTGSLARQLTSRYALQPLVAAFLMVFLDFFIEPVAIQLDFWHWHAGHIPFQNYIGWFMVSFLLQLLFQKWVHQVHRSIGAIVYGIQLIFFATGTLLFYFF